MMKEDELQKIWILRRFTYSMAEVEEIEFLIGRLQRTRTNADFFDSMKR